MERQKQRIRVLFRALCIFLFFQTALILFLGEPWPSISFPRFAGPGGQTQTFTVTQPVLTAHFADGTKADVDMSRFLGAVPSSHHTTVLGENYRPVTTLERSGEALEDGGPQPWTKRIKQWAANTLRSPGPDIAPAKTETGRQWTRQRLKELFPQQSPVRFVVEWQEIRYERSGDHLVEGTRNLSDKLTVTL